MTRASWHPEIDLTRLLDALTDELLDTPDSEVSLVLHRMKDETKDALAQMRRLLAAADGGLVPPGPVLRDWRGSAVRVPARKH